MAIGRVARLPYLCILVATCLRLKLTSGQTEGVSLVGNASVKVPANDETNVSTQAVESVNQKAKISNSSQNESTIFGIGGKILEKHAKSNGTLYVGATTYDDSSTLTTTSIRPAPLPELVKDHSTTAIVLVAIISFLIVAMIVSGFFIFKKKGTGSVNDSTRYTIEVGGDAN